MKAGELMTRNVRTVTEAEPLGAAFQTMLWAGIHHLPVMREDRLVGILSERDVLRHRANAERPAEALTDPTGSAMSTPVETASPDDCIESLAARLASHHIGCLPVVHHEKLVGIVTDTDLLANEARGRAAGTILDLPVAADMMTAVPATAAIDDSLMEAVSRMAALDIRQLPVVDEEGRVIGILCDSHVRDFLGAAVDEGHSERWLETRVGEVMNEKVITVGRNSTLVSVVPAFVDFRYTAVPVVDAAGRLVGILSQGDVFRRLTEVLGRTARSELAFD